MWYPPPQFNKMWLRINLKEAWESNSPHGYSPEPPGPQPLASLRDMRLTIMQAKHDASVAAVVGAAVGANTPAGDRTRAAAAITAPRRGRPAAVIPPMGTDASATTAADASTKKPANAKMKNPPPTPSA